MTGSATVPRGNLPSELTTFVGRRQLQDVKAALGEVDLTPAPRQGCPAMRGGARSRIELTPRSCMLLLCASNVGLLLCASNLGNLRLIRDCPRSQVGQELAPPDGFEPPTPALGRLRSIH